MIVVIQMTRFVKVKAKDFEDGKMKAQQLHKGEVIAAYWAKHGRASFNL